MHRNIMSNRKWARLSDAEKGQLVSIWILAADKDGQVPNDAFLLRKLCMLDAEPNLSKFIDLVLLTPTGRQDDASMTPERRQDDAPEAEAEADTEKKEKEKEKEQRPRKPQKRGSRLPTDWQPSDELRAWAIRERPDIPDIKRTIDSFTDYWRAKTGASACKLDWDATFRNWVRNERQTPRPRSSQSPVRETNDERRAREADEYRRTILAG